MNLKAPPLYILSFLILVFLVHEFHDWAHTLMATLTCQCWGSRIFDGWDFCTTSLVTSGQRALATLAGPIINYVLLWIGYSELHPENSTEEHSLGVALVFACLPLNNLMAAFSGGGDLTSAIASGPDAAARPNTPAGILPRILGIGARAAPDHPAVAGGLFCACPAIRES